MQKTPLLSFSLIAVAMSLLIAPHTLRANEISYGSLKEQKGSTLLLEYKGPAGTYYHTCDALTLKCGKKHTTPPALFPKLVGASVYPKSADGTLAVRVMNVGQKFFYVLYDISGKTPKKRATLPYNKGGATVSFSKNNDAVLFKNGLAYTHYDIATKKSVSMTLAQELAFLSVSPSASFITGYNYGTQRHELWEFATGKKIEGPSAMQSYLEFSKDETRVAFLEDVDGFRTVFVGPRPSNGTSDISQYTQLTKPKTEVEDYLFIGSTLYFLANVEGPLAWDLWGYDGTKTRKIEDDVSYGDFLKRVKTVDGSHLAYQKTTGKVTNVVLLSPNPGEKMELAPVKPSPASDKVSSEVKVYGKRTGVLMSPVGDSGEKRNLFIWMHGGPMRQVANGYHPYLSYAVYDELLERLAEGGAYVYKIDYTGSTGYGSAFRKALEMKVGDVEIKDIKNAIADIKKEKNIGKVYLIGNSYGGYMALRGIVADPKTIDGAVSIAGVSDWYGLVQQIPSSPFREVFKGVPDLHNLDEYKKASVFIGMDKLTKDDKVLVVWGEQDSTVPVWQSTKYLEFAKTQKATVGSLSFPDEDHILRQRKNLDALCKKVTSFLGVKAGCSLD